MSLVRQMKAAHRSDPRREIEEKIGDIAEAEIGDNEILAAVYLRPDTIELAGGGKLYLTDDVRKEDEYQGKVALVLKCGSREFSDKPTEFIDSIKPGDWIVHRSSDGFAMKVKGVLCHLIHYGDVKMRIPRPDYVY